MRRALTYESASMRRRLVTDRGSGRGLFVALLLVAQGALAQRAVILEFEGDAHARLHNQVENAVRSLGRVEILPLSRYKDAASRIGVVGARAMTPAGLSHVAKGLGISVALEGAVGDTFFVRILDPDGQELWSKELPLRKGLISGDHARKLASALAAAAQTVAANSAGASAAPPVAEPVAKPHLSPPPAPLRRTPELAPQSPSEPTEKRFAERPPALPPLEPAAPPPGPVYGPPLFSFMLTGTTTWRSYCSRPGVTTCRQYDAQAEGDRAAGDIVDFVAQVPYAGLHLEAEVFPLNRAESFWAKGIGLAAVYDRGFSLTNVKVHSPNGDTPEKPVSSADEVWNGNLLYRIFIPAGGAESPPLTAYVGARLGFGARNFSVDPNAQVPLPGTHRMFPYLGIEGSIPFNKYFGIEGGGFIAFNPKPSANDVVAFGSTARATGYSLHGGFSGNLVGPVGYVARIQYESFHDTFIGEGTEWATGGTAEESYFEIFWGGTVRF